MCTKGTSCYILDHINLLCYFRRLVIFTRLILRLNNFCLKLNILATLVSKSYFFWRCWPRNQMYCLEITFRLKITPYPFTLNSHLRVGAKGARNLAMKSIWPLKSICPLKSNILAFCLMNKQLCLLILRLFPIQYLHVVRSKVAWP